MPERYGKHTVEMWLRLVQESADSRAVLDELIVAVEERSAARIRMLEDAIDGWRRIHGGNYPDE